ncbi:DNA adenine methylase [Fluviicola taffensis]|uniref:DNA adenine methylase n=1 Tax=Fluviicola taffensis TaxID=191579 RepID=UPI003137A44F
METSLIKLSNKPKKINTPFGYFGSKNKIALQLCGDLPPHNCWVEAFCGSAALTLRKEPAPIEIINDIDNEIYNFFQQLRKNPAELIRVTSLTPYAEQELLNARIPSDGLNDLERARRFLVQSMMSINGIFGEARSGFSYSDSFSRNGQDARVSRWNNLPERLALVVQRLKKVRIENKDALKVLKRYIDRPNTLVYLDPPYLGNRSNGYNNDANDIEFHTKLLELANRSNCMIFISAYEHPLYEKMLSDGWWCKKEIVTSTKGSNGKFKERIEVVWMNKHYMNALNNKQVPSPLSAKEKSEGKYNPERKE